MNDKLLLLRSLIIDAAVCQLAIEEPDTITDAVVSVNDLQIELDNIQIALLDMILKDGHMIRTHLLSELSKRQLEILSENMATPPIKEQLWKSTFTGY